MNPFQPSCVDDAPVAIKPDYTRLRCVIAGLSVFHAVWLVVVLISIGPRLIERNAFALIWELFAILLGVVIAFRMRPVRSWRIALPVWIVFALFLPLGVIPKSPNGVWRPYMVLAVLVAITTALVPVLERLQYTLFHREEPFEGSDLDPGATQTGG